MERNEDGYRVFSTTSEATVSLREWTLGLVRWLHGLRDRGAITQGELELHRSRLNDISQITTRFAISQQHRIVYLQEKHREAVDASFCPSCGQHRIMARKE